MPKVPFMPVGVAELIADTQELSTVQFGIYTLLLFRMWSAGGSLPDDEVVLARIARCTIKQWRLYSPAVMEYFVIEDGAVSNVRLARTLREVESRIDSRASAASKAGKASALKRHNSPSTSRSTDVQPNPTYPESESKKKKEEGAGAVQAGRAPPAKGRGSAPIEDTVWVNQLDPLFPILGQLRGKPAPVDKDGGWKFAAQQVEQARQLLTRTEETAT